MNPKITEISSIVDYTLLNPLATVEQVNEFCSIARMRNYKTVCISSSFLNYLYNFFPDLVACSVVGFPLGSSMVEVKALEIATLLAAGASELDIVLNLFFLKTKRFDMVANELNVLFATVDKVKTSKDCRAITRPIVLKLILETGNYTSDELYEIVTFIKKYYFSNLHKYKRVSQLFIKTCTGFGPRGASLEDTDIIHSALGNNIDIGIKASGGIKTLEQAKEFVIHGATRLGVSTDICA